MKLDAWQQEVLATEGNMVLCSGRQVGKSTIVAHGAGDFCCNNPNKSLLIIAATERQAQELFFKVLHYVIAKYPKLVKKGSDRPTKHILNLHNGSIIRCLPTGTAGVGIRGYTIHGLIADEAAYIAEEVWTAVEPMLLTTGGWVWLLSTPRGKQGYFYERTKDPHFKVFHVNSEQVMREREISPNWTLAQREGALNYLERMKKTRTAKEYAQEFMGDFVDDLLGFFPQELLKKCMIAQRPENIDPNGSYFLGVDVARMGSDESTFEIVKKNSREDLVQVESIITRKTRLNETFELIKRLDKQYNFVKIYIDDNGIGVAVFDWLLADEQTKRKVVSINNKARPLDRNDDARKKMLKEDLYNNLLMLMETGRIKILDDDEIYQSFLSVQYEYVMEKGEATRLRIFGNYTHCVEGLIRAAFCWRDKSLNIWCA